MASMRCRVEDLVHQRKHPHVVVLSILRAHRSSRDCLLVVSEYVISEAPSVCAEMTNLEGGMLSRQVNCFGSSFIPEQLRKSNVRVMQKAVTSVGHLRSREFADHRNDVSP